MRDGVPELAGPCGPEPWYLEVGDGEDPVEIVSRLSTNLLGPPLLVHSTSWRRARGGVILSFIVVIGDDQAPELAGVPIARAELARNTATEAPRAVAPAQVVEHGLRHLAWLAQEDPVVPTVLSAEWKRYLRAYVPEPFSHI
jgi:hypothetical protein